MKVSQFFILGSMFVAIPWLISTLIDGISTYLLVIIFVLQPIIWIILHEKYNQNIEVSN